MVNVSAAMVKQLRDATGAGFLDCKKALVENDADFEASQDWLRQKGILKVASKSSRAASEGLVAVGSSAGGAAMSVVEINSETDFVSRNEDFQGLVRDVADVSCVVDDGQKLPELQFCQHTQKPVHGHNAKPPAHQAQEHGRNAATQCFHQSLQPYQK
jgi:elongation factor Ts